MVSDDGATLRMAGRRFTLSLGSAIYCCAMYRRVILFMTMIACFRPSIWSNSTAAAGWRRQSRAQHCSCRRTWISFDFRWQIAHRLGWRPRILGASKMGAIVGETTKEHQPKQNTFIIWRGASPANFELRLDYKLTGFNSGIQYRSIELPDIKWAMKGYQADIDGEQRYTGQIYEERARGFLALRGQFTYIPEGKKPGLVGSLGDSDALKEFIKPTDWNSLHILARSNTLVQVLNGHVMSMLIDDDTAGAEDGRAAGHSSTSWTADEN